MYDFMVNLKKLGPYQTAFSHSLKTFASKDPLQMAKNSGIHFDSKNSTFLLTSLGQEITISYPDGRVNFEKSKKSPLWQWSLILLNHLSKANDTPLRKRLISYRELEDGNVFYPAFYSNAILPLATFMSNKSRPEINQLCTTLGGRLVEGADFAAEFNFLPRFPAILKIWYGDDEIPASSNILFDASAGNYLHTEDIAVAGELISEFFLKLLRDS